MNPQEHAVKAAVRLRDRQGLNLKRRGYAYRNYYDFLLREGDFFTPGPFPRDWPRMLPRKCFFNALLLAVVRDLPYVEGMAKSTLRDDVHHHAWNLGPDGRVIDSTWELGRAYYGVRFSAVRANDATWEGDASVLQDHGRRWDLLREPWLPEDSPGDTTGLLEKMARDAIAEPDFAENGLEVDQVVDMYRRIAVGR